MHLAEFLQVLVADGMSDRAFCFQEIQCFHRSSISRNRETNLERGDEPMQINNFKEQRSSFDPLAEFFAEALSSVGFSLRAFVKVTEIKIAQTEVYATRT